MINPVELRIGNVVEYNGEIHTIAGVTIDYPILNTTKYDHGVIEWKDLKGVEFNEKWFNKFRFKKEELSDHSAYYYTLNLNDHKYCDLAFSSGDKNGFIEVTLFPYEDWFRYKYVHQFQNLYLDLYGQELKFEL